MPGLRRESLLAAAFVIMAFNSLYQYSWNAFAPLISSGLDEPMARVELAFVVFVVVSTLVQLATGPIADVRGPRAVAVPASLLSAVGFLGASASSGLREFIAFWAVGSAGEGALYGVASNVAVKWFPDRRGLATGLVSLGYGIGSAIANPIIGVAHGFRSPATIIGEVELVVLVALSVTLKYPSGQRGVGLRAVALSWRWWLLYASFTLALVPLVAYSGSLAELSGVRGRWLYVSLAAFPLASGLGRPLLGALSDRLGRTRTAAAALLGSLVAVSLSYMGGPLGLLGVILVGLYGGALIPLYFAIVGDLYGERMSTSNTALIYTGKALTGLIAGAIAEAALADPLLARALLPVTTVLSLVALLTSVGLGFRGLVSAGRIPSARWSRDLPSPISSRTKYNSRGLRPAPITEA